MLMLMVGTLVGAIGTLVGVGGGFLLVPFLLYYQKNMDPGVITAIGLFCVMVNGLSGTATYLIKKQVHLKSAFLFALVSLPAAIWSTSLVAVVDRRTFELLFATLLIFLAIFLIFKKNKPQSHIDFHAKSPLPLKKYIWGALFSVIVGFMSFFGVGGGIFYVPYLIFAVGLPVHLATGTSQFIITIAAALATYKHFTLGHIDFSHPLVLPLAIGMVIGSQFSSRYSRRVNAQIILYVLAGIILLVGSQMLYRQLFS